VASPDDDPQAAVAAEAAAVATRLADLDPDTMTPRDALAALYELRKLLGR
jgi:DNA mismatch repair protein MutS